MDTPTHMPTEQSAAAWQGALAGIGAGAAALAAGELAAALAAPRPGPVLAVANRVVDEAPGWFVDFGKQVFGLADKPALMAGTIIIALVVAACLGVASLRRPAVGIAGIGAFGLLGTLATAADVFAGVVGAILINAIAVAAGVAVLLVLLRVARRGRLTPELPDEQPPAAQSMLRPAHARRAFLGWAGAAAGGAAVAGVAAGKIRGRSSAEAARSEVVLADAGAANPVEAVTAAAAGPVAQTEGISPLVVPNDNFYRIDTALLVPQVDPADWSMTIKGMVDNEVTFTYDELVARATTIETVTLSCVSNEVGGNLVGNAVWQGVPLTELLDEAGVQPGASQIASRSVDGWTCGFPTELAYDGRTALVAIGMNDEPLPTRHGFPARLVISGLYGYVSATKWLSEIELTTLDAFDGYWIPRGWSKDGPIKTQSRIDTPRSSVVAGQSVPIAGVAWAPNLGITKVEVRVDGGDWAEATLGESLGEAAWRQWRLDWTPEPGSHSIEVRATDSTGEPQTSEEARPAPNGASGYHSVSVTAA